MTDMLVNLYQLPEDKLHTGQDYSIRKVVPPEKGRVVDWVKKHFSEGWADECDVACSQTPANCLIAVNRDEILGFACYDTTFRNFFGPTGVVEFARGQGIGFQLLLYSLLEMKQIGYAYAIIGDAGPTTFYEKSVHAVPIEGRPVLLQAMKKDP